MEGEKIIVAASGYFDPLHVGHVEYLEKAKTLGDKLIVILKNSGLKPRGFLVFQTSKIHLLTPS